MKNNKIAEALQNIEASEPAKERIFSKVKAYANSAAKPKAQPAIVKWLPLTTAACLLVVAAVLIFPFVRSEPTEPPVSEQPSSIFDYDFDNITANTLDFDFEFDINLVDVYGHEAHTLVVFSIESKNDFVFDEDIYYHFMREGDNVKGIFSLIYLSNESDEVLLGKYNQYFKDGVLYMVYKVYGEVEKLNHEFVFEFSEVWETTLKDGTFDILTTNKILNGFYRQVFTIDYTPAIAYNFTIHENTFDFDVELLDVWGDEKNMFALFAFTPKNGFVFEENEFYGFKNEIDGSYEKHFDFAYGLMRHVDKNKPAGISGGPTERYIENGVLYSVEGFTGSNNIQLLGEEYRLNLTGVVGLNNDVYGPYTEFASGALDVTFTADYEPRPFFKFDFDEETIFNINNVEVNTIIKSIWISDISVNIFLEGYNLGYVLNMSVFGTEKLLFTIKFADGKEVLFAPVPYEAYSHSYGTFTDVSDKDVYSHAVMHGIFVEKFNIAEIKAIIINGQEFALW